MFEECLAQTGRADAPGAHYAVWLHGLRFFISENLEALLLLACGFGPRELELLSLHSPKYPTPATVIDLRVNLIEVRRIIDRISKRYQGEAFKPNGSWIEQTNRILSEVQRQNRELRPVSQPLARESVPSAAGQLPFGKYENPYLEDRPIPDHADERISGSMTVSPDFMAIRYAGEIHRLTPSQAKMFRILVEAHNSGRPSVGKATLLRAVEAETSEVRNFWKKSGLWGTLIKSFRKGSYELALPRGQKIEISSFSPVN